MTSISLVCQLTHNWPSWTCIIAFATRNPTPIPRTSTHIGQSWTFFKLTPSLNSTLVLQSTSFDSTSFLCPSMAYSFSLRSMVCVFLVSDTQSTNSTRKPSGPSLSHFCQQLGMRSRLMLRLHEHIRTAINFYGFWGPRWSRFGLDCVPSLNLVGSQTTPFSPGPNASSYTTSSAAFKISLSTSRTSPLSSSKECGASMSL